MTVELTTNIKRYGSEQPLPTRQTLHAGPVEVVLEGGDLRYIRLGPSEIIRRLYMAVRDQNWGTIQPVYPSFTVQDHGSSFRVDFTAEHVSGDVDFAWTGTIEGADDGTIVYTLDGAPRKPFLRNRIGFCVLHPSDLAGTEASVETPDGRVDGLFPVLISPDQPFIDMQSITHPIGASAHATITFTGELFEMEDQRNWTDASYKTYGTPLRLPYPVEVDPSTQIQQSITIAVSGVMPPSADSAAEQEQWVKVDLGNMTPLPPVGFGAGLGGTIEQNDLERLRVLKPAHLWVSLDLGTGIWREDLVDAAARATALAAPLELSVVAGPGDTGWNELVQVINAESVPVVRVYAFPAANDPIAFPRTDLATHDTTIAAAKQAFLAGGIDCLIGGGTRAYFTEFNRAQSFLPIDQMDVATYTINPQVHAFDNLSVIECISAQPVTVSTARAITGETPLIVGPVTLRPPFNPNATGPVVETQDELPFAVDPRQLSLLGAGWTVGSLHQLAEAGVAGMTFYELYGWRGLIERERDLTHRDLFPSQPGQLFPLYHVFAAAALSAGGSVCAVEVSDPFQVEALALRKGDAVRLMIANLAETVQEIRVSVNGLTGITIEHLDETTYADAMTDPGFSSRKSQPAMTMGDALPLTLKPFAVAFIDGAM